MKKKQKEQMDLFGGKKLPIVNEKYLSKEELNERQKFLQELQEIGTEATEETNVEPTSNDWDKNDWKEQVLQMTEGENENLINRLIDEEKEELKKLQEELEQDKEDGILMEDEPFYVKDNKLYVVRYQDQINANISNLAKSIIDTKWKQNINPKNISVVFYLDENGVVVYESVVCLNEFGVRFRVMVEEILEKLQKIPFDD